MANTAHVLAIEIYTASRALHLRKRQNPQVTFGKGTTQAYQIVRDEVKYQAGDAWWAPEIDKVKALLMNKAFENLISD